MWKRVSFRQHLFQIWVRLLAEKCWVDIGVAAGQKDAVKALDRGSHILSFRDQSKVDRHSAGGLESLAVIAAKIKSTGFYFEPHRDSDARAPFHKLQCSVNLARDVNLSI